MDFQGVSDCINLISSVMTILGLGGLFSWSIVKRSDSIIAYKISSIFAYSLKTALALILLIPFIELWKIAYAALFRYFANGAIPELWDASHPFTTIISHSGSILFTAPIYLMITACLYLWSLAPARHVWQAIRRAA